MKRCGKIPAMLMSLLLLLLSGFLNAQVEEVPVEKYTQTYTTAVGLRLGTDAGISYKQFITKDAAIEGIFAADYSGMIGEIIFEKHLDVFKPSSFSFFYGGGVYAGVIEEQQKIYFDNGRWAYYNKRGYPAAGVEGIVGLEYKIPKAPFTTGIDLKPRIGNYYPGYSYIEGALTVRYIFGRVNNVDVPR